MRKLWGICLFLLLITAGLTVVLYTDTGTRWIIINSIPDRVKIEQVKGNFGNQVWLTGLRFNNHQQQVNIKQAMIAIELGSLLQGQLHIKNLIIDNADIKWIAATQSNEPLSIPSTVLNRLTISNSQITQVKFALQQPQINLNIKNFTIKKNNSTFFLDLNLENTLYENFTAASLHGFLNIDLQPNGYFNVRLQGKNLSTPKEKINTFTINSEGTTSFHQIKGSAELDKGSLAFHVIGKTNFEPLRWEGNLAQVSIVAKKLGTITFKNAAQLAFEPKTKNIQGNIHLALKNIHFLNNFISQAHNLKGEAAIQAELAGHWPQVTLQGTAQLSHGQAYIPSLNIRLYNAVLNIIAKANKQLFFSGKVYSEKGMIELSGDSRYVNNKLTGHFRIFGNNFLISRLPEYKIQISPTLTVKQEGDNIWLTGNIFIPKASIHPQQYSQDLVTMSNDVEFVNEQGNPIDKTPLHLFSNIVLQLGDFVNIDYYGLKGQLTGKIHIRDAPAQVATGSGQLNLSGTYKAYGQTLQIQQGQLLFNGGDIANPGLNISAIKKVNVNTAVNANPTKFTNAATLVAQENQLIVGIEVQGTVKDKQLLLFSQPPVLTQTDILSYLILGRPAAQATQADAQLMYNAAAVFDIGNTQFNNLSQQVKNTFGLDEINVGSMATTLPQGENTGLQNTSVILGKALSPKLYLNYSIGLLQPVNTLRLRYFMTPQWILQSETSSLSNALDVFYTFAR